MRISHHERKGFTLIELLVVISIISLLSSVLLVALNGTRMRARVSTRVSDMNTLRTVLEMYATSHNGSYPSSSSQWWGLNACNYWPGQRRADWIPEVVSLGYISALPHDPSGLATPGSSDATCGVNTYIYRSNATDYKLIVYRSETTDPSTTACKYAPISMLDPVRGGVACGFWTNGAASW